MGVNVVGTRRLPTILSGVSAQRTPGPPVHIRRRQLAYWEERGWQRSGNAYVGTYKTAHGSFLGLIEDRGYGDIRFYIVDPPREVRQSAHWTCFSPRGEKGYHVHMSTRPRDVSSGILTIERLISEAFQS